MLGIDLRDCSAIDACPNNCPRQMIKFGSLAGGHCKKPSYSSSAGWDASRRQVLVFTPTAYHALSQQALCSPPTSGQAIGFQGHSFPVARTKLANLGRVWPIACRLDLHYGFLFQRASTILERATHCYEKYPHGEQAEGDRRLGWTSLVDAPWRMQPCRCPCNGST